MSATRPGKASINCLGVASCLLHSHAGHNEANEMQTSSLPIAIASSWQTSFVSLHGGMSSTLCLFYELCTCLCNETCSTHAVPGHAAAVTPATVAHTAVADSRRHDSSEGSCQRQKAASCRQQTAALTACRSYLQPMTLQQTQVAAVLACSKQ